MTAIEARLKEIIESPCPCPDCIDPDKAALVKALRRALEFIDQGEATPGAARRDIERILAGKEDKHG